MARFPVREADIVALAQRVIAGLMANPTVFPSPPVTAAALQAVLTSFSTLLDQVMAAQAAAKQVVITKNAGLEELMDALKAVLRYAELTAGDDEAKLALIGWSGKAAPVPTVLEAPGEVLEVVSPEQGETWVQLEWKAPVDGGTVASYKIERRLRPAGDWSVVGVAVECEAKIENQERGKDWEYRVIAVNKAGDGPPSNTAAVVL